MSAPHESDHRIINNTAASVVAAEAKGLINHGELKKDTKKVFKMSINEPEVNKVKLWFKQNLILILTISGVFGGIAVGFLGRIHKPSDDVLALIYFPGELLLRILKMLILPLIISSLISGLAQLDPKSSGKMGSLALFYYFSTTIVATITGIILVVLIHPGNPNQKTMKTTAVSDTNTINTVDAMLDIVRNMFPDNIVQACTQQVSTFYRKKKVLVEMMNSSNGSYFRETLVKELKYTDGTNVMGIVVFCFVFGIFISQAKSEAQVMYDLFVTLNELIMRIVGLIMWFSPLGILCLIATNIIKIDDLGETAKRLGLYMLTVILGLIIHALITIQLVYFLVTRKNPLKFLKGMLQAWLTAVGTASSAATLPITFRCLEENNKIDKRVTRFMLPLGATINMDGTALYEAVAAIFIAQLNGRNLGIGQLIAVSFSSTATSIGAASIPSAALVTMLIVLSSVGLPTEDLSYIIAVDWLLDRLRTSINVLGDAYGAAIVAHLSRNQLKKLDDEAEQEYNRIMATTNFNVQNIERELSEFNSVNNPDTSAAGSSTGGNAIHRLGRMPSIRLTELERRKSHCSSSTVTINRPPSLNAIEAVRKRSKMIIINPGLASPMSYQTIPYIHENETNL